MKPTAVPMERIAELEDRIAAPMKRIAELLDQIAVPVQRNAIFYHRIADPVLFPRLWCIRDDMGLNALQLRLADGVTLW